MSYLFDANSERIKGQFSGAISKPFTLVAWVRRSNTQWLDANNVIFADLNDDDTDLNSQHLIGNLATAQRAGCRARSEADGSFHQSGPIWGDTRYDDTWVTVIGVFRSDTDRQAYVEAGNLSGTGTTNDDPTNAANYISIGGSGHTNFDYADALVAEVAVFDKALSEAEIAELQTGSGAGPPPNTVASANCVGYWPLLDDQTNHPDMSGNGGPTLSITGSPTWSSEHPSITQVGGETFNRVLTENTVVTDPVDEYQLRLSLDRPANSNIGILTDSIRTFFTHGRGAIENFSLADAVTIRHYLRRLRSQACGQILDSNNPERSRNRVANDSLDTEDGFTRAVIIGDTSETFFRIKAEFLRVTDSVFPTFLGIFQKLASESMSLGEAAFVRRFLHRPVSEQVAIVSDLMMLTRYTLRKENIRMADDLIVTRAPIIRLRTLTDTFGARDFLGNVEQGTFLSPSVRIETGIQER